MPTNREIYFSLLKENNKYLNKNVITSLLADANEYDEKMTLYMHFDDETKNVERLFNNVSDVKKGIPFQYVLGYSFFLGNKIIVNNFIKTCTCYYRLDISYTVEQIILSV